MKLFFIDDETTGTDSTKHGLIQLAGIIEIDGEEKERVNLLMSPFKGDLISQEALKVNGRTIDELRTFPDPIEVYNKFIEIMSKYVEKFDKQDKFQFVGYNSRFDDDFCRAWFEKCKDKYYGSWFFWPAIDVANMAAVHFMEKRHEFPNFKLMTVCKTLEIEVDESRLHNGMYDIELTREAFYKLKVKND